MQEDDAKMIHSLEYAPVHRTRRRWRMSPAVFNTVDVLVVLFFFSQLTFLLAMMSINIHECGVAPYGYGSSYKSSALGNDEFVLAHPKLAASIANLYEHRPTLEMFCIPAFFSNLFTVTIASWIAAGYLTWRCFRTRSYRRIITASFALLMWATLPWIWPAVQVALD